MTDSDPRELDGWIAEFFVPDKIWRTQDLERRWEINPKTKVHFQCPRFTVDPSAFALVKREVERRGWGWTCYRPKGKKLYMFEVSLDELTDMAVNAETEELAGCLAVKAAVEGSK